MRRKDEMQRLLVGLHALGTESPDELAMLMRIALPQMSEESRLPLLSKMFQEVPRFLSSLSSSSSSTSSSTSNWLQSPPNDFVTLRLFNALADIVAVLFRFENEHLLRLSSGAVPAHGSIESHCHMLVALPQAYFAVDADIRRLILDRPDVNTIAKHVPAELLFAFSALLRIGQPRVDQLFAALRSIDAAQRRILAQLLRVSSHQLIHVKSVLAVQQQQQHGNGAGGSVPSHVSLAEDDDDIDVAALASAATTATTTQHFDAGLSDFLSPFASDFVCDDDDNDDDDAFESLLFAQNAFGSSRLVIAGSSSSAASTPSASTTATTSRTSNPYYDAFGFGVGLETPPFELAHDDDDDRQRRGGLVGGLLDDDSRALDDDHRRHTAGGASVDSNPVDGIGSHFHFLQRGSTPSMSIGGGSDDSGGGASSLLATAPPPPALTLLAASPPAAFTDFMSSGAFNMYGGQTDEFAAAAAAAAAATTSTGARASNAHHHCQHHQQQRPPSGKRKTAVSNRSPSLSLSSSTSPPIRLEAFRNSGGSSSSGDDEASAAINLNQPTIQLTVARQPPVKTVYQRIIRPFPSVMVDIPPALQSADEACNLFVECTLVRSDSLVELAKCLDGTKSVRLVNGSFATFTKLKIRSTSQQQGTQFKLRFSLKRCGPNSFETIEGAVVESHDIEVFSHTVYLNECSKQQVASVSEVLPAEGRPGARVVVLGLNFLNSPLLRVRFGNVIVPATFHEAGTLICVAPTHLPSSSSSSSSSKCTVHVQVSNDGQQYSDSQATFTFKG
jgi:IPT/TIG domain